jgi:type I restriction enzyme R subunit
MELDSIMPPINPFDANANREGKIATVLEKLKAFFKRFSDISDGVFKSEEVSDSKKYSKKAQEIQMKPKGSMLEDVEADNDVRRLVHNMMELYEGTTIMNIVVECQKEYQERYFSMKTNDWRHLLRDYVRKVTERPELQEDEVFRYVMAG